MEMFTFEPVCEFQSSLGTLIYNIEFHKSNIYLGPNFHDVACITKESNFIESWSIIKGEKEYSFLVDCNF